MIEPQITKQIGGYLFEWSNALSCRVSRLDVHSDGRVTGELFITNKSKEKPTILLPSTQFNFSSEPTRVKFARQMSDKLADESIEWTELFDYLGHKVQELARTGELSEEVWASDEIQAVEFLINPLVIRGMSNIIFGEKGVNKSTIAYLAGAIISLPWLDNPLEMEVSDSDTKCLVLDWETDEKTFRFYTSRIKRGCDSPVFGLNYRHCVLPLAEDLEAIETEIERTKSQLLIIDSLAAAAGGEDSELKGSQSALRFNSALRKLGLTSLIIAQTSKSQPDQTRKKTIYGSTIFTYYARNIFELCHSEDIESNVKHLALFHRECNLARKSQPIGIRLEFRDDNGIAISREPVSISEFSEKVSTSGRILDLLKSGKLSQKVMKDELEVSYANLGMALKRLNKQGKVIKVGDEWGLPLI